MKNESELFENHLEFLATHRGSVTHLQDSYTVESDRAEFTYAILTKDDDALLERFKTVHLLPWDAARALRIRDLRFQARGGLSYMTLEADTSHWKRNSDLRIVRVSNPAEMDVFSHVQAKGFAPDQEDYGEWHPWLKEANQRNLENKSQTFYIGYLNNEPIGTTLLVEKNGTAGIYAVATLSEARKQGVGTTLMAEAIVDAKKHACEAVTLQVAQNSYAESLYKKLGFQIRFAAKIFGR